MPTPSQISEKLFKKSLGKGDSDQGKPFFEEDPSIDGFIHVVPAQIWRQADQIPNTSPFGVPNATSMSPYDGSINGVVQYMHNLQLIGKPATGDKTYFNSALRDSIAFNFGNGSYNYFLTTQGGTPIAFGQGDWVLDNDQGALTFYGTVPSGVSESTPPRVSFYKYVGGKGLDTASDASGTTWSTFQLDQDASGVIIENNNGSLDIKTWDNDYANLRANHIDVSTLKIDNLSGILVAQDGSILTTTFQALQAYTTTIVPDGSTSVFAINHNLNTLNHVPTVYQQSTNNIIYPDLQRGLNTDYIAFFSNPPIGEDYDVIILGF